jgi:Predicted 3'-5' exonuclease related to the exonuclease domain of PolB
VTTVIVWDVETIPDLIGFARANRLDGKTDEEIREAIGDKFPKHIYHSIVGALIASDKESYWEVDALGAPHVGYRTEKELISAFVNKIDELKPQLVTFNGSGFDLPVLRYRAMVNEIAAPGLSARPYGPRDVKACGRVTGGYASPVPSSWSRQSPAVGLTSERFRTAGFWLLRRVARASADALSKHRGPASRQGVP